MNDPWIKYLAENATYKVYSIHENVYLKNKSKAKSLEDFEKTDEFIDHHYGDPNAAIFINGGKHLVIGGCGISIYNVENKHIQSILNESEGHEWIFALYQDNHDDMNAEFRFVTYFQNDKLRVYKMNVHSLKIEMLN